MRSGTTDVPAIERIESLEPHLETIQALFDLCKGNRIRVHEELGKGDIVVPYTTLTAFLRRHKIGVREVVPSGRYITPPGQEMQHDTSPHRAIIGGKQTSIQTASLVLAHSRMIYVQCYPRFTRFYCKVFLTEALRYFGGAASECIIDNTHVVILRGTGPDAVVVPEMESFSKRFGFVFRAHEVGDANRSGKVERPFHYIENNFLCGRQFDDWAHLNREAVIWCDRVNARHRRHLQAAAITLFQSEKPKLVPLPIHIPDVYDVHARTVDVYGYVSLHRHRYSAPASLLGHRVEVREYKDTIQIHDKKRTVAVHKRQTKTGWSTLPEHRGHRVRNTHNPLPEEAILCAADPVLARYVEALKEALGPRPTREMRQLHRIYLEYPLVPLRDATTIALHYRLFDLARLERIVLRRLTKTYFRLPGMATDNDLPTAEKDPSDERQSGPTSQEPATSPDARDRERRDETSDKE